MENNRITGFDFARAFAILGMMLVNYKIVFNQSIVKYNILNQFLSLFEGRAAAVFVILAGVGIGLMTKKSYESKNTNERKKMKITLLKRALFLFVLGIILYRVFGWTADILHFYGVYIAFLVLFIYCKTKTIISFGFLTIVIGTIMQLTSDYSKGWDQAFNSYEGLFTLSGFIRNTFLNGYHPFFPWFAFILFGLALSRLDFNDEIKIKKLTLGALAIAIIIEMISIGLQNNFGNSEFAIYLFDTKPMNPTALYIVAATAWAISFIGMCVILSHRKSQYKTFKVVVNGGQMALTHYLLHVLVLIVMIFIDQLAYHDEVFVIAISFIVFLFMLLSSHIWLSKFERGPIEFLMRKVTK